MVKQNAATDPVSAAMSAIESALNLTDDEAGPADANALPPQLAPTKPAATTPFLKPSQIASETPALLRASPSSPFVPESGPKPAIPAATPANDDRENVGAVLQAMNARPASRTPFVLALVAALLWATICALYAYVSAWPAAPEATHSRCCCDPRRRCFCWRRWAQSSSCSPLLRYRGGCSNCDNRRARFPRSPCV